MDIKKEKKIKEELVENSAVFSLQMHESMDVNIEDSNPDCYHITRVPGGWLYKIWNVKTAHFDAGVVFVPFSSFNDNYMQLLRKTD